MNRLIMTIMVATLVAMPITASAAPKCTRSDLRTLSTTLKRIDAAVRTFENSRIKDICKAGRRAISEFKRAEKVIKARPKCTLATAADRRDFARAQRAIRQLDREFKKGC